MGRDTQPVRPNRVVSAIGGAVAVLTMNHLHEGYEKHWWWDNVVHFMSGFVLGMILPEDYEEGSFLGMATVWELFEWYSISSGLSEKSSRLPQRAMGTPEWSLDHQVEDTALDTIVGYWGVKVAKWLK